MIKFKFYLLLSLSLLAVETHAQNLDNEKPNIIFIMADDLGFEAIGSYGNDNIETPNLDKLAAKGMQFTNAYSTPLCSPTRVQVMTGKYNFRNYTGFGLLDEREKTFAHLLKDAGYIEGITGKWQLLGYEKQQKLAGGKRGAYPTDAGFYEYSLWQIDALGSRYKHPTLSIKERGQWHSYFERHETKVFPEEYGPDLNADFALDFVESNQDTSFFLYYPMTLPHSPFQPTPDHPEFDTFKESHTPFKDNSKRVDDTIYFKGMVEYIDKLIGKIVDKVDELGLNERTIIIFTSDNGTDRRVVSSVNGEKIKGDKGGTTKYGTKVPLIVHWDGVVKPNQVNDNLIDFTDFLPTFMEAAGAEIPDNFLTDGLSFYKQLLNQNTEVRDWIFCSYDPNWGNFEPNTYVHNKKWKLYGNGDFYNVKDDPEELNPLPDSVLTPTARIVKEHFSEVIKEMNDPEANPAGRYFK